MLSSSLMNGPKNPSQSAIIQRNPKQSIGNPYRANRNPTESGRNPVRSIRNPRNPQKQIGFVGFPSDCQF